MSQTQTTSSIIHGATTLSLPRYHTSLVENFGYVPPEDFTFPDALKEVPINPKGPTEVPLKTAKEYTLENVCFT